MLTPPTNNARIPILLISLIQQAYVPVLRVLKDLLERIAIDYEVGRTDLYQEIRKAIVASLEPATDQFSPSWLSIWTDHLEHLLRQVSCKV